MRLVILSKAKKLPDGTIRDWKGKKYQKVAGKWKPYKEGEKNRKINPKNRKINPMSLDQLTDKSFSETETLTGREVVYSGHLTPAEIAVFEKTPSIAHRIDYVAKHSAASGEELIEIAKDLAASGTDDEYRDIEDYEDEDRDNRRDY